MKHIAVIDYGLGNLHSVQTALMHVRQDEYIQLTSDPNVVDNADAIVFPGVGAIRDCMQGLSTHGLDDALKRNALIKPTLGICVGMQALFDHSEENAGVKGLGILPGQVIRFIPQRKDNDVSLKVPHMGWNQVKHVVCHPLWAGIADQSRFYFVHSYYVQSQAPEIVSGLCDYGHSFTAAAMQGSLFAVQFHPEKSQSVGLQLLRNFLTWDGTSGC